MNDIPTCVGAGAHGRARCAQMTCAGLLALALALAMAASANAAFSWPNEPAMIADTNPDHRATFILDPGWNQRLSRADLLEEAGYFDSKGFNRNFLTWSVQNDSFNPPDAAQWAGCESRGVGPTCADVHLATLRLGVLTGPIPSFVWGDAFIARGCGNYSAARDENPMPTITGKKYEDENGDGMWNSGEPGLSGWTIRLYRDGDFVGSTTTGGGGGYSFSLDATAGRGPGSYTVTEEPQANWVQSSPNPPAIQVPYGAGTTNYPGNDFGNYRPATINGSKYEDMEADGDRDSGDPLLGGWTIDLGTGPSAPAVNVTDLSGAYAFSGLRPGRYTVAERLQGGWRHSAPADGAHTIVVRSGETATRDFGNYRPATIEGVKFDDHDIDRERDAGEPGLPGWTIGMTGGRSPDATDVTDADGSYAFGGLIPGTYTIAEELKPGWRQSAPASGTHSVTVRSGETKTALFGNVCLGATEVRITDEVSGATISGVEVRLEQISVVGVLANDPVLPRTTTGTPTFADLLPGTYRVIAFLPTGMGTTDDDIAAVEGRLAVVKVITVRECQTTVVPIKLIRTSTGKVTGGMKMAVPGGFATAGFVFMTRQGRPEGSLEYQDHVTGLNLHSEDIDTIHVAGRHAWITGTVVVGGAPRQFWLHLVDNGEPGSEDRFHLLVDNGYEAGEDETIIGGNDQIHPPEHV